MKNKILIAFFIILSLVAISLTRNIESIEDFMIPMAIGYDIEKSGSNYNYSVPMLIYNAQNEKSKGTVFTGIASSIGETRQERQLSSDKKLSLGLEKLYIISEATAQDGIGNITDILFTSPQINDKGEVTVCQGKTINYLQFKKEGINNIGDYIADVIKNSSDYNFFSKRYRLMDLFVRIDAEGRNAVLPYIIIRNNYIYIDGLVLFKGAKMIARTNMDEARNLNILREDNSQGIITVQKNAKKYIDTQATIKRKVDCKKIHDMYYFNIKLDVKVDVVSNCLYDNLQYNLGQQKALEKEISKKIEKDCNNFIYKMKNKYKVDCLELGRNACAKYKRNTGTDWNKVVCNSHIKVTPKVTLDKLGRGDY